MEILALLGVVMICIVVATALMARGGGKRRYRDYDLERAEENLEIITDNQYSQKNVCNRLEREAYVAALSVVLARQRKERVLAQVCLGSFLTHRNKRVYSAINSKRVDLLITDDHFKPLLVVEIDGSGHNLSSTAKINDTGKAHALQSAGIALLRIAVPDDDLEKVKMQVRAGVEDFFRDKPPF